MEDQDICASHICFKSGNEAARAHNYLNRSSFNMP